MRPSLERQLGSLEELYRELLLSALQKCAMGRWGLFGSNLDQRGLRSSDADELLELGSNIERVRQKYGLEPFVLHDRLLRIRSSRHSNTPGEPKLARQWLDELTHL
jgi:hypothetical protein